MHFRLKIGLAEIAGAVLLSILSYEALISLPTVRLVNKSAKILLDCKGAKGTHPCLPSEILAITGSIKAATGSVAKAAPTISDSVTKLAAHSAAASDQTVQLTRKAGEALDNLNEGITEVRADMWVLNTQAGDLVKDGEVLLASSNDTVKAAGVALTGLAPLLDNLNKELAEGSPKVNATLDAIKAIVSDPKILETLGYVDDAAKSGASVVETINIDTLPLRQKAKLVIVILNKLFNLVKLTFPL